MMVLKKSSKPIKQLRRKRRKTISIGIARGDWDTTASWAKATVVKTKRTGSQEKIREDGLVVILKRIR